MTNTRFLSKTFPLILIAGLVFAFIFGCGASRQSTEGEDVNIDELLGDENTATTSQNSDEDEVLRLLGITPQPAAESTPGAPTESAAPLESEISNLQDELTEKDREISSLRSEITQRESKISELQSQIETPAARSNSVRSGSFADASTDFRGRYQNALNQFNSRNYQQALSSFNELLATDPNNSLSDNCQYWIGECYYAMGNYNQAV
ncbi:MAG TPA: tetratricopeptide repeat protein, partial [bacterium]